ncbi:trp operon repressor [Shewanella japonica]|uniref:trp operon repressor n=1 Tax=Shewanella japonica TaxID=93973 RepID=UPI0024941C4D|nr:trp operon repressor [Shewanella japonica]
MRANWESVIEKVLSYPDSDELNVLFQLLLTEEERSAVAGRLKVFQLLLQGELSQRQISADYQVSIATITRCSNYLKNMNNEHRELIRNMVL